MMRLSLILFLFLSSVQLFAQEGSTRFGLQYKPIIPNRLIGTYDLDFSIDQMEASLQQKLGHSYGMIVRYGLTDAFALETGLNYTHRRFGLNWAVPDSGYSATDVLSIVSYELPLRALVFIRLGEGLYMNTSLGASLTMFSSDVSVFQSIGANEYFLQEGAYRSKVQGAFLANVGFEYRTRDAGYFYIGSSYHLPFSPIMDIAMSYEYPNGDAARVGSLRGSYLTLDLRYFLPENKDE